MKEKLEKGKEVIDGGGVNKCASGEKSSRQKQEEWRCLVSSVTDGQRKWRNDLTQNQKAALKARRCVYVAMFMR